MYDRLSTEKHRDLTSGLFMRDGSLTSFPVPVIFVKGKFCKLLFLRRIRLEAARQRQGEKGWSILPHHTNYRFRTHRTSGGRTCSFFFFFFGSRGTRLTSFVSVARITFSFAASFLLFLHSYAVQGEGAYFHDVPSLHTCTYSTPYTSAGFLGKQGPQVRHRLQSEQHSTSLGLLRGLINKADERLVNPHDSFPRGLVGPVCAS